MLYKLTLFKYNETKFYIIIVFSILLVFNMVDEIHKISTNKGLHNLIFLHCIMQLPEIMVLHAKKQASLF